MVVVLIPIPASPSLPSLPFLPSETNSVILLHSDGEIVSVSPVPIAVACITKQGFPLEAGIDCSQLPSCPVNVPVANVYVNVPVGFVILLADVAL